MKMKTYQEIQSNSHRWFDVMLMLLSCVAGCTDIISYYRLGHVFTANMTGNVILPRISIEQGELSTSLYRVAGWLENFAPRFLPLLPLVLILGVVAILWKDMKKTSVNE